MSSTLDSTRQTPFVMFNVHSPFIYPALPIIVLGMLDATSLTHKFNAHLSEEVFYLF